MRSDCLSTCFRIGQSVSTKIAYKQTEKLLQKAVYIYSAVTKSSFVSRVGHVHEVGSCGAQKKGEDSKMSI